MPLTPEQQKVVDHVKNNDGLVQINAVAGSGKTFLLTEITKAINPTNGLYLAYNKSIAKEAQGKFPKQIACSTTHSLAYRGIQALDYRLNIEDRITYRILPPSITYEHRCLIIEAIEHFCVTEYLDFAQFAAECLSMDSKLVNLAEQALNSMLDGSIPCSHSFYLKLFHIALHHQDIEYEPFDILMLDEAGDINLVTLEIFKLLPANKKIMVGDPHQNIYSFNKTVNCFDLMKKDATIFPLSKSFRVSNHIASEIQYFCRKYLHEEMTFEGIPITDPTIKSEAIIARTNSSLIVEMLKLNEKAIPYNLTRSPDNMFKLLKMLCLLKPRGYISVPGYTYLQKDVDNYYKDITLQKFYKSHLNYIKEMHAEDVNLCNAIQLIFSYGTAKILSCYNTAKAYHINKKTYPLTLGTAHSTKGLEFDKVTLAPDMNRSIREIIRLLNAGTITPETMQQDARTELNLYYVACSRSRIDLENAEFLIDYYYTRQLDELNKPFKDLANIKQH